MGSQQLNARVPDGIAEAARAAAADAGVNLGEYIARLIDADTQSRRALFDKAFDNFIDDAVAGGAFDAENATRTSAVEAVPASASVGTRVKSATSSPGAAAGNTSPNGAAPA